MKNPVMLDLLKKIKLDLEMRSEKDSDGVHVVNLSSFLWNGLNEAIAALEAEQEPVAVVSVSESIGGHSGAYVSISELPGASLRDGEKLYRSAPPAQAAAVPDWDEAAYKTMCDNVEYWKDRAVSAESDLETIRNDLGPTYMGGPLLQATPAQFKVVPIKPTTQMLAAGQDAWLADPLRKSTTLYCAMVNAAPVTGEDG